MTLNPFFQKLVYLIPCVLFYCSHIHGHMHNSSACRHCCSELHLPSRESGSFVETLVYSDGGSSSLSETLQMIEEKAQAVAESSTIEAVSLPGIVIWCSACRKMSVISYQHYCQVCMEGMPAMSMSAYYTRMCIGAELLMQMHGNKE